MIPAKWTKVRQGTRSQLSDNIDRVTDMVPRPLTLDSRELLFSLLLIMGVLGMNCLETLQTCGWPALKELSSGTPGSPPLIISSPPVSGVPTSPLLLRVSMLFRPPMLRNRWLLFGQTQGLGALPQEMRNCGKQGTAACLLCRPQGLVLCH